MRKLLVFILLFCLIASLADAQNRRRRGSFNRKKQPYKYEFVCSLGASNFLGDLGGADQIGTNGFKDLELSLTRPSLGAGMRISLFQFLTAKGNFFWGNVRGNDKLTLEPARNLRNLNFKSNLFELSGQFEYNFMKSKKGHVYQIKGVRGMRHREKNIYLFVGGGLVHFNPKGLYNGKWYDLQPLGTEGQGILDGKKKYKRTTGIFALGGGTRFAINRYWGFGFELGLRKSFSDYLDDVSTVYPKQSIYNGNPVATNLSNPMDPANPLMCKPCDDLQRGDPTNKDAYMFVSFTIGYKVIHKKRSRSKF